MTSQLSRYNSKLNQLRSNTTLMILLIYVLMA